MRIGNASLTGQQFGLITSATGFSDVPSSGLLGLAFSNIALVRPCILHASSSERELIEHHYRTKRRR